MVDTVQPQRFAGFRNRSASSLLMKMNLLRWNNAEPTPGPDTRPASSMVAGTGCRGENPRLRRREKNVLDIPSYRTGVKHNFALFVHPEECQATTGTVVRILRRHWRKRAAIVSAARTPH